MKFIKLPNGQVFNVSLVLTTTIQTYDEGEGENKKTGFVGGFILENQQIFPIIQSEDLEEVKKIMSLVDEQLLFVG